MSEDWREKAFRDYFRNHPGWYDSFLGGTGNRASPTDPTPARLRELAKLLGKDEAAVRRWAISLALVVMQHAENGGRTVIEMPDGKRHYIKLPPLPRPKWAEVLGIDKPHQATEDDVRAAFKARARECHPDVAGGSHEATLALNDARDAALAEI